MALGEKEFDVYIKATHKPKCKGSSSYKQVLQEELVSMLSHSHTCDHCNLFDNYKFMKHFTKEYPNGNYFLSVVIPLEIILFSCEIRKLDSSNEFIDRQCIITNKAVYDWDKSAWLHSERRIRLS